METKAPAHPERPIFASLLSHPGACRGLLALAVVQIGLVSAGLPAWPCPILAATDVPCPGCGLTHACVALLGGDWRTALTTNPVAPVVVIGVLLVASSAVLPAAVHPRFVSIVARIERITRITWMALAVMLAAWGFRLV